MSSYKNIFLIFVFILFISSTAFSVCTVTFDKEIYSPLETINAAMVCTEAAEKSQAYTLTWRNDTGVIETDTGTTPSSKDVYFYETYTIPLGYTGNISANLTGTNLEGYDNATVAGAATTTLLITDANIQGTYLGLSSSFIGTLRDSGGNLVTGGKCGVHVYDNTDTRVLKSVTDITPIHGEISAEWILDYSRFEEATDYVVHVNCFCGPINSTYDCQDEIGTSMGNAVGDTTSPFTTDTWITMNEYPLPTVHQNGTDFPTALAYAGYEEKIYYRANITNNQGTTLKITNQAILINNDTGERFEAIDREADEYSVVSGNNTMVVSFEINKDVPTGVYYLTNFFDMYYENLLVAQGIADTVTFNVTGTSDTLQLQNVATDKTNYYTGEYINICANVTNNFDKRIEFKLNYNYRCGSPGGGDFSTDRSILGQHAELRAVNSGQSQYQCATLQIPFEDHLLYTTTNCYASVTMESEYITTYDNKISVTSPQFNTTDYGYDPQYECDPTYPLIRLFPDWRRYDTLVDNVTMSYYESNINITALNENYLDPTGVITDDDWDIYLISPPEIPTSQFIYNYTVEYANGTAVDNPTENKDLQWFVNHGMDDRLHGSTIGIENVNFTDPLDDYFVTKVWFEDVEERSTEALEDIANKTGTFHLEVNCDQTGYIGHFLDCIITAQVEESQLMEKEVDFTCYIDDGISAINFNKMITREPSYIEQSLMLPATLEAGPHTVRCEAHYYNLGSRSDSFYTTFKAETMPGTIISEIEEGIPLYIWIILIILIVICICYFYTKRKNKQ